MIVEFLVSKTSQLCQSNFPLFGRGPQKKLGRSKKMSEDLTALKEAYQNKKLTLYLGAGASVANGLPSWEQLVLAMYFSVIGQQSMEGWRPFPNYLMAISQWYLSHINEPLDITIRKLQKYFHEKENGDEEFIQTIYRTLYSGLLQDGEPTELNPEEIRTGNMTLDGISKLCENSNSEQGIRSVITYNYDDLLEVALGKYPHQSVANDVHERDESLPIYHVHGFIPISKNQMSKSNELVFTEEQYNRVAADSQHWSNKIQVESMSNSVGLMIGLSISDRNMRRILDTLRHQSISSENYALLQRPQRDVSDEVLDSINAKAIEYLEQFRQSGGAGDYSLGVMAKNSRRPAMKKKSSVKSTLAIDDGEPRYRYEIRKIIGQIERLNHEQHEFVLRQLGVTPIWYDDFSEIPQILEQITHKE